MALTINGEIQENKFNSLRKISETYNKSSFVLKKKTESENKALNINREKGVAPHELKSYLSETEIKVLGEVFGAKINRVNDNYSSKEIKFLRGSKLDIRL
ncbi:MAG: hypothetical protein CSB55_07520 [Candidatus Cloacimonadota bacterium]|nr:MAG: hypothetical protein CSB55_07520 [Candidatus Cloacimonadota bacterium]